MTDCTIQQVDADRIADFVQCQFEAFVGHPLHEVAFPDQEAARKAHTEHIRERNKTPSNEPILLFAAVEPTRGDIVGGTICRYYMEEATDSLSPHAAGMKSVAEDGSFEETYRQYVMNQVLTKRIRDINGKHACKCSKTTLLLRTTSLTGASDRSSLVHPSWGRPGIGRELLARACSVADERGLRTFVEASPVGKRTYEKCGFSSTETVTIGPARWTGKPEQLYYFMERARPPMV